MNSRNNVFNSRLLLLLPGLIWLLAFFVLPYINMAYISLKPTSDIKPYETGFTLANYAFNLTDTFFWEILYNTVVLGLVTTVICLLLAYPVAHHLARTSSNRKGLLFILILSPLLVGVVIRCYGWMILLADRGLINETLLRFGIIENRISLMYNHFGVTVGLVQVFLPFMILSLFGSIQTINPELEYTSRSLGASRFKTFFKITLPLSLPGIVSGSILVFVLSVSTYAIPILLGGNKVITAPLLIVETALDAFNWPGGSSMALVMFAVMLLILTTYMKIMNRAMKGLK